MRSIIITFLFIFLSLKCFSGEAEIFVNKEIISTQLNYLYVKIKARKNIPVFENGIIVGAISESGLFNKMLVNSEIKTHLVKDVLENPYPEVSFDTPVERLSNFINKENGAVMSKDDSGLYQIVTKYDIIQSLSK